MMCPNGASHQWWTTPLRSVPWRERVHSCAVCDAVARVTPWRGWYVQKRTRFMQWARKRFGLTFVPSTR